VRPLLVIYFKNLRITIRKNKIRRAITSSVIISESALKHGKGWGRGTCRLFVSRFRGPMLLWSWYYFGFRFGLRGVSIPGSCFILLSASIDTNRTRRLHSLDLRINGSSSCICPGWLYNFHHSIIPPLSMTTDIHSSMDQTFGLGSNLDLRLSLVC
jgi:hypothetical protein